MIKRFLTFTAIMVSLAHLSNAQSSVLDAGIRLQKDIGLYSENGIALSYSNKNLMPDRLYFGFSYVTSRLGTALNSNAIKQDNYLLSAAWYFRKGHMVRPFVRENIGYFSSDYPALFDILPHSSLLLSTDGGISVQTHSPVKIAASLGYNVLYGQGNNNEPGTLYPLFYQLTLSYNLFNRKK